MKKSVLQVDTKIKQELIQIKKPLEYLLNLSSIYYQAIVQSGDMRIMNEFSDEQKTIYSYTHIYAQVSQGGFVQLLENKYGQFLAHPVFLKTLARLECNEMVVVLSKVLDVYIKNKTLFDQEKSVDDFAKLYQKFPQLDVFETEYKAVLGETNRVLYDYIQNHLVQFV